VPSPSQSQTPSFPSLLHPATPPSGAPFLPLVLSVPFLTSHSISILAVLITIAKYKLVPQDKWWMLPSTIAIGVSFILNATTYPLAMGMGATIAWLWQKFDADSHAMYMYAVAAGFIAGEGMGGIVTAILQIASVSGAFYGTSAVSGASSLSSFPALLGAWVIMSLMLF